MHWPFQCLIRSRYGGATHEDVLDDNALRLACSFADNRGSISLFILAKPNRTVEQRLSVPRPQSSGNGAVSPALGITESHQEDREEGFRILRPAREIDFDAPRPSPYANVMNSPGRQRSHSAAVQAPESSSILMPHRPAPRRPNGSLQDRSRSYNDKLIRQPEANRSSAAKRPVSSRLIENEVCQQDLGNFQFPPVTPPKPLGLTRLNRGSSENRSRVRKDIDKDKDLPLSFENAPEVDDAGSDSEEDACFWAVKPLTLNKSTNRSDETQDNISNGRPLQTLKFSEFKHQSMKIRNTRTRVEANNKQAQLVGARERSRPSSPEYRRGDDDVVLGSPCILSPVPLPEHTETMSASQASDRVMATQSQSGGQSQNVPIEPTTAGHAWSIRPSTDLLYENLQTFFPGHDLDKPIVEEDDNTHKSKEMTAAQTHSQAQRRMKSIRVVAKEASDARKRFQNVAYGVRAANLLRRRSTKVWGQKAIEVKPTEARNIPPAISETEEVKRTPTFKWLRGELIGKGQFGNVYLAMNVQTGEMLAVKQVDTPDRMTDMRDRQLSAVLETLNAEIETMRDLDHINIVQYLGYERTQTNISIFLEYVPGGSIGSCLRRYGKFCDSVIRSVTRQTLEGLQYLHHRGILHRDLKADNLLLDLDGVCKISDFGISKRSRDVYANDGTMSMQGTIFWMAPEVIQTKKQGYSAKIDM